jgi:hypothetical protein
VKGYEHEENPSPYIVRKDMDVNEHEENPSPYNALSFSLL